jgi:hypothetical protein
MKASKKGKEDGEVPAAPDAGNDVNSMWEKEMQRMKEAGEKVRDQEQTIRTLRAKLSGLEVKLEETRGELEERLSEYQERVIAAKQRMMMHQAEVEEQLAEISQLKMAIDMSRVQLAYNFIPFHSRPDFDVDPEEIFSLSASVSPTRRTGRQRRSMGIPFLATSLRGRMSLQPGQRMAMSSRFSTTTAEESEADGGAAAFLLKHGLEPLVGSFSAGLTEGGAPWGSLLEYAGTLATTPNHPLIVKMRLLDASELLPEVSEFQSTATKPER